MQPVVYYNIESGTPKLMQFKSKLIEKQSTDSNIRLLFLGVNDEIDSNRWIRAIISSDNNNKQGWVHIDLEGGKQVLVKIKDLVHKTGISRKLLMDAEKKHEVASVLQEYCNKLETQHSKIDKFFKKHETPIKEAGIKGDKTRFIKLVEIHSDLRMGDFDEDRADETIKKLAMLQFFLENRSIIVNKLEISKKQFLKKYIENQDIAQKFQEVRKKGLDQLKFIEIIKYYRDNIKEFKASAPHFKECDIYDYIIENNYSTTSDVTNELDSKLIDLSRRLFFEDFYRSNSELFYNDEGKTFVEYASKNVPTPKILMAIKNKNAKAFNRDVVLQVFREEKRNLELEKYYNDHPEELNKLWGNSKNFVEKMTEANVTTERLKKMDPAECTVFLQKLHKDIKIHERLASEIEVSLPIFINFVRENSEIRESMIEMFKKEIPMESVAKNLKEHMDQWKTKIQKQYLLAEAGLDLTTLFQILDFCKNTNYTGRLSKYATGLNRTITITPDGDLVIHCKQKGVALLGMGTTKKVTKALLITTNGKAQMKAEVTYRRDVSSMLDELNISDRVKHPNILAFSEKDVISMYTKAKTGEARGSYITDLCDGTWDSAYSSSEKDKVNLGLGLARALKAMHDENLIHGDIKPGNIGIIGKETKLFDMGCAADISDPIRSVGLRGSPKWWSPRYCNDKERHFTPQDDLWSMGCSLFQLFYIKNDEPLFTWVSKGRDWVELSHQLKQMKQSEINQAVEKYAIESNTELDKNLKEIILACLQVEESKVTAGDIIKKFEALLKEMDKTQPLSSENSTT